MLKRETLHTAGAVAVGFVVAFLIVGTSQTFQSCISEHYHHEPSETFQKGVAQFLIMLKVGSGCTGEFVHKNAESITALFTVILGTATWLLWRATKKLVEGAADTAKRQLRAYVSVAITGFQFDRDPNLTLVCKANFDIRNDGQTPAYDVRTNVDFRIAPQPLIEDFTRPKDNALRFETSISPHRSQEASGTKAISFDNQKLLPGQKLYFLGLILYKDAFSTEQETWFCGYIEQSEFVMDPSPGVRTSPVTFHWAERHNKTT